MSQDLACKFVNVNVNFSEFLLLELTGVCTHNKRMLIGIIYRSPNSVTENDLKLFELINTICSDNKNNLLLAGDFNWPNIEWSPWSSPNSLGPETKFLDTLRKNFLLRHINKPTRARGDDEPHILDLVLTNEPLIDNIEFLAPLGKSDHSILNIYWMHQDVLYDFTEVI